MVSTRLPSRLLAIPFALAALVALGGCGDDAEDSASSEPQVVLGGDGLQINEIQMLGSHNSYHLRAEPQVADALEALVPDLWAEIDYEHVPLEDQLSEYGIRQFELDVFADPDGGLYSTPAALEILDEPPPDEPSMEEPGFKVQHVADIDYNTTCLTFVECLQEIEEWSSMNPTHLPVMIMVETKGDDLGNGAGGFGVDLSTLDAEFAVPPEMTPELFDDLEAEVLSVFPQDRIITPDDIRGNHETLESAVLADGWPTIMDSRGRVMFSLVDTGESRDLYVKDAPALEGKLFFTSSEEGRPDAAFLRVDDSTEDPDRLDELSAAGYLIRTRTDEPGIHAPNNDTSLRDSAFLTGGHYLSTDQYVPYDETGFVVELPGDVIAVCNPVSAPNGCESLAIEE